MFILWISICLQSLMKFHHCLFKILRKNQNVVDKVLQRAITLTELAPSLFFILIQMFILWISICLQSMMKFHHCLFKILRKNQNVVDKVLQRAITLTEFAPSPYFSIINVHLVDINVFAKFYEILSMSFKDIVKPKRH